MTPRPTNPFASRRVKLAHGRSLFLGPKSVIMGILNVTPDSFSDGGRFGDVAAAVDQAHRMIGEGASIIDIGGESTRPGAGVTSQAEEQDRVLPVIEALAKADGILLSIDTYRAETADLAVKAGCHMINDVWGFQRDAQLAAVAAKHKAGCCAMHTGRERVKDADVIRDQFAYFEKSLAVLSAAGVADDCIVLDPGYGFAKDAQENIELLARAEELLELGFPVMTGTSRKRFIGHVTDRPVDQRDIGTAATSVVARMKGASIFRVHDVRANRDALAIADAVVGAGHPHKAPQQETA